MTRSDCSSSNNHAKVPLVNADRDGSTKTAAVVFHKTRMCRFHIIGKCTRGNSCLFAHTPDALRARPDFARTRVCPFLIRDGFCNSFQCKFAHNKEQLRHRKPTEAELQARGPKKASSSCRKGRQTNDITKVQKQSPVAGYSLPVDSKVDEDPDDFELATCSGSQQTSWSRQTTEDSNERNGGGSPRLSEESSSWADFTWSSEVQRAECEEFASEAAGSGGLRRQQHFLLSSGLSFKVKNTFLEFTAIDAEMPRPSAMRRGTSVPKRALA